MTRASGAGSAVGLGSWVGGLGSWFGRGAREYVTSGNGPAVTSLSSVLDPRKNEILDVVTSKNDKPLDEVKKTKVSDLVI